MKLTSQEEYGLRCLLRVGREGAGGSLTIPELARAEGISEPNVAKMMRILRRAGFVKSTRGQSGGYSLSRPAEEIMIGHVLATLGGRLYEPAFCDGHSGLERLCTHMPDCSIRSVWRMVQQAVDQVLGKLTVKDLLRSEPEMNAWRAGAGPALPAYSPQAP
jgi:Rrf2 family protein